MCYKCDGNFLWFITWMLFQTKPVTSPFFYHHMRKVPVHLLKRQRFPPIILIVWCTLESGINHSAIYCLLQSVLPECQPHLLKMNHSFHQNLLERKKKKSRFMCKHQSTETWKHTHTHIQTPQQPITPWTWASFTRPSKAGPAKKNTGSEIIKWIPQKHSLNSNGFWVTIVSRYHFLLLGGGEDSFWYLKQFVSAIGKEFSFVVCVM